MEDIRSLPLEKKKNTKSFFNSITQKISNLNKRLLNEEITPDPLKVLEKEANRGCLTERSEGKPKKIKLQEMSILTKVLRSEHKLNNDNCILNLPKMPFGKHLDYNSEQKFVLRHFLKPKEGILQEQADELREISKKFRIIEKQHLSHKRNKTSKVKTRFQKRFEAYNMDHGQLVCKKELFVQSGYENDKEKYKKYLYQPHTSTNRSFTSKIDKTSQEKSVERLLKIFKKNEQFQMFKTKYSTLFEKTN